MRDAMGLGPSLAIIATLAGGYAVLVAVLYARGGMDALIFAVLLAPLFAMLAAQALVAFFPAYFGWVKERTWTPWQGRYYVFDQHQIRIAEADGLLWFSSADVHAVLAMPRRAGVLERFELGERRSHDEFGETLSHAGLVRLLARRTDAKALHLLRWAYNDVLRPWEKKRERGIASRTDP